MVTYQTPVMDRSNPLAIPMTYAAAWTDAVGEIMRASLSTWSAIAETCGQANEAYAAFLGRAINLEAAEALALTNGADRLLQDEVRALEDTAEHLAYAAEETLGDITEAPLIPLPD